ncbi:TRAFAC clade GTPase domain-containing protein [Flindersiella endophytica]
MGYVAAGIAILIGVFLYLALCAVLLVYVVFPILLAALLLGALGGIGLCVVQTIRLLLDPQLSGTLRVVTPDAVASGVLPGRTRKGLPPRDRAWPGYFVIQIRNDWVAAAGMTMRLTGALWSAAVDAATGEAAMYLLICWPLTLIPLAFLVSFAVAAVFGILLVGAVLGPIVTLAWVLGFLVAATLRSFDLGWQLARRAHASCPTKGCYHVTRLPAYKCFTCGELHRDLRPGVLGVLSRYCACGTRLPTTVLRAGHRLQAICQKCGAPLHSGAAVATDVRIPVFGAPMAGKTRLIMAGAVSLRRLAASDGSALHTELPDEHSKQAYAHFESTIDSGTATAKTAQEPPAAVTVRLKTGSREALVHLFDAAGEQFVDQYLNEELSYLDHSRTLVFVLDPFSVPELRDQLAGGFDDELAAAGAVHDPEDSYQVTVQRLRKYGTKTHRQKLAFVVSKADRLLGLPVADGLGSDSAAIQQWLKSVAQLDNLLLSAERDFDQVRYFLVAAMDADPEQQTSALAPFQWLLATDGMALGSRGKS